MHTSWSPLECQSAIPLLPPLEEDRGARTSPVSTGEKGGWEAPGCLGCVLPRAPCLFGVRGKKVLPRVLLCLLIYSCVPVSAASSPQLPKPCATVLVQTFPLPAVAREKTGTDGKQDNGRH